VSKIVLFGLKDFAELAFFYLTHDSSHQVVAFTVHKEYINASEHMGLPVVPFEDIQDIYPPDNYKMFVPMSYTKVNKLRAEIYLEAKEKGYKLISYISSKATYYNTSVGENCFILENNVIQPYTNIGNNVIMWSGNHIGHHSSIEDHCFLASHVVVSGHVAIGSYSFIGVNATIKNEVLIGQANVIGAGSLILKNTPDGAVFSEDTTGISKVPSSRLRGM
jgi:sugar O-acyltransferase (sialic acid O-acetyltransferase NeuD family)